MLEELWTESHSTASIPIDSEKAASPSPVSSILLLQSRTTEGPFFADFTLGRIVVRALRHLAEKGSVESVAFVVMPDHLHWLLSLNAEVALSAVMKSIKGYSAHEITNIVVSRSDSSGRGVVNRVWQNGFHDHALRKDEEVDAVARYLVMNPVRAGIVADIWQYPLWDAIWVGES
jgi:putative transposase